MAARVSGGSESFSVHSTGCPDLAAQPAAGIANSGLSAGAIRTASVGSPAAAIWNLSIAWASEVELEPSMVVTRWFSGFAAASPIRITCASPASSAPDGASSSSASSLAAGSSPPSENRTGALQRARHQLGGGDRGAPVFLLGDHHRARAALVRAGGVDGARRSRRRGDRIAAGDARRVLGGEDGKAERGRVLGLLLVASRAEHGLLRIAAAVAARFVAVTAAAAGDQGEQEDGQEASKHRDKPSDTAFSRYPGAPIAQNGYSRSRKERPMTH